ncbi:MAG TPA: nucleotide sugar dehydrogenase [Thermohalobaculum sp.]|nr:nucleotide sugar dehydrogenase [Thermohalobaculum sp.]
MISDRRVSVIGLGYVGLPVAVAMARNGLPVVGFDIDAGRIGELVSGRDRTNEVPEGELNPPGLTYTSDPAALVQADFHIVTVPTPIDGARRPDLRALLGASRTVGQALKPGDIVVYESTVYPGATEEDCVPVLEAESGLKLGRDFAVGYSPERINPGDREHRFETLAKIVSASDPEALEVIHEVYGRAISAPLHRASSIRVAEAAKVIENTQRDLNIALVNELSMIFDRLGIDTRDVLAAAGTKWNFLPFHPGLVGGHCIGVDPFYLTHKAEQAGYHPQVILAGRRVNDGMSSHVAKRVLRDLVRLGRGARPRVTVLGVTFKANVPDTRNTKVADLARELRDAGVTVQLHDPHADAEEFARAYGMELTEAAALAPADAVILATGHRLYLGWGWGDIAALLRDGAGVVADLTGTLDRAAKPEGIELWRM